MVSIGGKKTAYDRRFGVAALTPSANGSRFAYAMGGIKSERLVLDEVEQRGLTFPHNFLGNNGATARIAFSPDGKHARHPAVIVLNNPDQRRPM